MSAPPHRNYRAVRSQVGLLGALSLLAQADSCMKFEGGAPCRRQPSLPESGRPGHCAGRAGIRGRARGLHIADRTLRDQDVCRSEVVR